MSQLLHNLKSLTSQTTTTNGDLAYSSVLDSNIDFFYNTTSFDRMDDTKIASLFKAAYLEDKELAVKNLLYLRDRKGGNGRRSAFRRVLRVLAKLNADIVKEFLPIFIELGRFDDILAIYDVQETKETVLNLIRKQLTEDLSKLESEPISLLAKWLPSVNASNHEVRQMAVMLAKDLGMNNKTYRKTLSQLRAKLNLIENKLRTRDYNIDYDTVPAKALLKYTKAFNRHDKTNFDNWKNNVSMDKLAKKSDNLFLYEILGKLQDGEVYLSNKLWEALPKDTMNGNVIVVLDGSGSMHYTPITNSSTSCYQVAASLAIYAAERLQSENFRNKVISFSNRPKFIDLDLAVDNSLSAKYNYLRRFDEVSNTNIEATYNLLFNASKEIPKEDQIDTVIVLSDMQFNAGSTNSSQSTFDTFKDKFTQAGLKFPKMVYWNLAANNSTFPTNNTDDCIFVSGFSKAVFKALSQGNLLSAQEFLKQTFSQYDKYFTEEVRNLLK